MVMPSVTERGFYTNFRDGAERWEDFIVGPFMDHLRETLPVSRDARRTFLAGASMALNHSDEIKASRLQIYLEAGD